MGTRRLLVASKGGEDDLLIRASFAGGGDELLPVALLGLVALVPGIRGDIERFMLLDSGDLEDPVAPCNLAEDAEAGDEDEPPKVPEFVRLSMLTRPSLLLSLAGGVGGGLDFLSGMIRPRFEGDDERRLPLRCCVSTLRPAFGLLLLLPGLVELEAATAAAEAVFEISPSGSAAGVDVDGAAWDGPELDEDPP